MDYEPSGIGVSSISGEKMNLCKLKHRWLMVINLPVADCVSLGKKVRICKRCGRIQKYAVYPAPINEKSWVGCDDSDMKYMVKSIRRWLDKNEH